MISVTYKVIIMSSQKKMWEGRKNIGKERGILKQGAEKTRLSTFKPRKRNPRWADKEVRGLVLFIRNIVMAHACEQQKLLWQNNASNMGTLGLGTPDKFCDCLED